MATLTIRRLDEPTKKRLRLQAAQHGVSMEEEARSILRGALSSSASHHGDQGQSPAASRRENPEGWRLKASLEEILAFGAKPPVEFDQKAVSDELYDYLEENDHRRR